MTQSKGEIYLGAPRGHACFFPGLPWWPTGVPPQNFQPPCRPVAGLAHYGTHRANAPCTQSTDQQASPAPSLSASHRFCHWALYNAQT